MRGNCGIWRHSRVSPACNPSIYSFASNCGIWRHSPVSRAYNPRLCFAGNWIWRPRFSPACNPSSYAIASLQDLAPLGLTSLIPPSKSCQRAGSDATQGSHQPAIPRSKLFQGMCGIWRHSPASPACNPSSQLGEHRQDLAPLAVSPACSHFASLAACWTVPQRRGLVCSLAPALGTLRDNLVGAPSELRSRVFDNCLSGYEHGKKIY